MDITGDRKALRNLLATSRTVAVVGASPNPTRDSHRIAQYLIAAGYDVIPVNPGHEKILGKRCYPSILDVPVGIDIVDIFRRPEHTPAIVEDAIQVSAKCVWFQLDTVNEDAATRADGEKLLVVRNMCIMVVHRSMK